MSDTTKLDPLALGTREYWDNFYKREVHNFSENPQDTGEEWFQDLDASTRMCQFLGDSMGELALVHAEATVCDLGTGNGRLLIELREEGFDGPMTGVDYSATLVEFAKAVAAEAGESNMAFEHVDLLADQQWVLLHLFDIVLDKGTLDAIALSDLVYEVGGVQRSGVATYPTMVAQMMASGSVLLITSCNFSEQELIQVVTAEALFEVWRTIKYPLFQFGGVQGSTVCSVAFVKK